MPVTQIKIIVLICTQVLEISHWHIFRWEKLIDVWLLYETLVISLRYILYFLVSFKFCINFVVPIQKYFFEFYISIELFSSYSYSFQEWNTTCQKLLKESFHSLTNTWLSSFYSGSLVCTLSLRHYSSHVA